MSSKKKFYIGVDADKQCVLFYGRPIECSRSGHPATSFFSEWGGNVEWYWRLGEWAEDFGLLPGQFREVTLGQIWETDLPVEG